MEKERFYKTENGELTFIERDNCNVRVLRNGYEIVIRDIRGRKLSGFSFFLGFALGVVICGIMVLVFF